MNKNKLTKLEKAIMATMIITIGFIAWVSAPKMIGERLSKETTKQINTTINLPANIPTLASFSSADLPKSDGKTEVIVLGAKSTVKIRGPIDSSSVAKLEAELLAKSADLSKNDTIYMVMDTPGGEVDAGNQLIDLARSLPQKVKTITIFSASMGFHIVQSMDERLILPSGTLMSHRMYGGSEGNIPGSLITRVNFWLRQATEMDARAAQRIGINLEAYQNLIRDEYWVNGQDSVDQKMADRMVLARCSEDLMGTESSTIDTIFGPVGVTYSKCPIITGILALDLSQIKLMGEQKGKVEAFFNLLKNDQKAFVEQYILTGKFKEILP